MDNSNYAHFHGGGDFSDAYVIMHEYFGKILQLQKNEYISFYKLLHNFFAWLFHAHVANIWGHQT